MNLSAEDAQRLARFSLDHSEEAALWLDVDGSLVYANAAAEHVLHHTDGGLLKKTLFQLAPELNQDLWRELWKEIRAHESFSFEFALKTADGQTVAVDIVVHRIALGSREMAVLFFHDIEERKRLKELEQGFVSTVSHELRTPLTVIREGVAQVVDGIRGDINEMQQRALSLALIGIDRLGRLIEELLDLSKMESGRLKLRLERVDLAALVRDVSTTFQATADERHIKLRVDTPATECITYASRDRLIQVLTNLINNALKFTEQGQVELKVTATSKMVTCAVNDTGMGFPPEQAQRIFNRFEQLDTLSVTGEKGSGLGLSICKGIVELHKGRIWAESLGPKQGSHFFFELPCRDAHAVFREELTHLVEEASPRGGSVSAILFNLTSKGIPETRLELLLDGLENLIQQERGRRSDVLIKDTHAIYAAIPSVVEKEAIRVADRIQAAFDLMLSAEERKTLQMTYRVTSFPQPFSDAATFIQQAVPMERI